MFCRSLFVVFCLTLYCLSIYGLWLSILYLQSVRGKRKCLNTHINSQLLQAFAIERFLQIIWRRKLGRTGSPIYPCFIIIFLMQNNDLKTCKSIGRHFKLLNIRTGLAHRRSWYGIITLCFTLCFTYLLSLPSNVWRLVVFAPFLIIIIIISSLFPKTRSCPCSCNFMLTACWPNLYSYYPSIKRHIWKRVWTLNH